MPRRDHQSSPRFVVGVAGGSLAPPVGRFTFFLSIADGATDDIDFAGIAGLGYRILNVIVVKVTLDGGFANSVQLQTAAGVAIGDAVNLNGAADFAVFRALSINDASHEIAAGGGLRVHRIKAGGNVACHLFVTAVRT